MQVLGHTLWQEYLVYLQELFLAIVKDSIVCLLAKSINFSQITDVALDNIIRDVLTLAL